MTSEQSHDASPMLCEPSSSRSNTDESVVDDASSKSAEDVVADLPSHTTSNNDSNLEHMDSIGEASSESEGELVEFKVVFNKQTYNVKFPLDSTVESLKRHIESLTNVPVSMQKIMLKGRMQDNLTLRDHRVTNNSKIMVVGSTVDDVMAVNEPAGKVKVEAGKTEVATKKEPLSRLKAHKTVLDKYGKPDDAMPGIKNKREPLPPCPLSGMYNKAGGKVRLTFKLESDQLWIGTKERTEKVALTSIKAVVSEEIEGHEEYHLLGLQLGPTELSRYWIYWVPAQYIDAIKDAVLGNWQYF